MIDGDDDGDGGDDDDDDDNLHDDDLPALWPIFHVSCLLWSLSLFWKHFMPSPKSVF